MKPSFRFLSEQESIAYKCNATLGQFRKSGRMQHDCDNIDLLSRKYNARWQRIYLVVVVVFNLVMLGLLIVIGLSVLVLSALQP